MYIKSPGSGSIKKYRQKVKPLTAILLLVSAATVLSCARGESRVAVGEELLFDLISNLDRAAVEDSDFRGKYISLRRYPRLYRDPWSHGSPRIVKVGFEIDAKKKLQIMRRAIHLGAHRNSPCRISVPLGDIELRDCLLTLSLAAYRTGRSTEEGRFRIGLTDGGREIPLYDSGAEGGKIPERKWLDVTVAIPDRKLHCPAVTFDLATKSESTEHIFIANPRIFRRGKRSADTPNIVFICIDALRTDAVNAITDRYRLTPNIDSLARDGFTFTNHFVVSNWTRPSTIAMLASRYASSTGVNLYYPPVHDEEKEFFYRESGVTPLSTVLKQYGYITRSIGNNSFIIDYTGIGVDLDFEDLSEYETQREDTVDLTEEVISWLRANRHRRFFLSITYNAPHNAYIPPERYVSPLRKRFRNIHPWFRAYLGEVAYTDDYLGRVLAELRRLGLYDNTIIVVTSDHAEIFNRAHEMSPYTDKKSIYTHGQTQFDEELRSPLIIKPPSCERKNVVIAAQVRNIDIPPTILELMHYRIPDSFQGRSLLPLVRGEENTERVVYSEGRMMYSVRWGGYKYAERFYGFGIRPPHWGGDQVREYRELYDLREDPDELRNICYRRPDIARRMRDLLMRVRFQQPENVIASLSDNLSGRIRVIEGFLYDIRAAGPKAELKRISRKEYRFRLSRGEKLVYQTIPAFARVHITVPRNERLLCGRYLLPLAKRTPGGYMVDPADTPFGGKPEEKLLSLIKGGALYWNLPAKSGIREVKREKYLSKDINRLLRDWGYIQGKEKKTN
jgi:arylsulfatase A-like enzyme